jgi:hypothetical protein
MMDLRSESEPIAVRETEFARGMYNIAAFPMPRCLQALSEKL